MASRRGEAQSQSRKAEQGDATREALLAAARKLFAHQGYAATSLDDIAQEAGVTKGALYHHFTGKEQLFRIVLAAIETELSLTAFPVNVVDDDAALWRDLVFRCRTFIEEHADPRVQRIVLVDARSVLSWDDWRRIQSEHGVVAVRGYLRRAMHRGIIAPVSLSSLSQLLGGALTEGCMLVATAEDRSAMLDEVVAIIERLLSGLRPRVLGDLSAARPSR